MLGTNPIMFRVKWILKNGIKKKLRPELMTPKCQFQAPRGNYFQSASKTNPKASCTHAIASLGFSVIQ